MVRRLPDLDIIDLSAPTAADMMRLSNPRMTPSAGSLLLALSRATAKNLNEVVKASFTT